MTFGGETKSIEVPVVEPEAKVEVVAEATEQPADDVIVFEAVAAEEVVAEETATEVIAEDVVAEPVKTEIKEFQSGQIIMLVIAGVALLLGAVAVFGISTKRKE